jgi:hypothetical protein
MRYICSCPSCGFRLTRRFFFRFQDPLRADCPGCSKRLRSVRWLDYFWSLLLVTPVGFLFFYALTRRVAWWLPAIALVAAAIISYLSFPYVTKITLDEDTKPNAAA